MRVLILSAVLIALAPSVAQAEVKVEPFGKTADDQPVQRYTLTNANGMVAKIMTRGATLQQLHVPDGEGKVEDVVLGFDDVAGYESEANQYFGCTVGRVCNRIGDARFQLLGVTYKLTANDGDNMLHGGAERSFDKVVWEAEVVGEEPAAVEFRYFSPDGEEGFPGNVHASVRYVLTKDNALVMSYKATSDMETPINMTNHAYFNLGGAGAETILDHHLKIAADSYTPTDDELIPTGKIASVEGTPLDFRKLTPIGERIDVVDKTPAIGYDHNWVLNRQTAGFREVAILKHPQNGRVLKVLTDQPGLQFYSGNFLNGQTGKDGKTYAHRSALCLEAQHYPDSVNHENFPSTILVPGREYTQTTMYRFETE